MKALIDFIEQTAPALPGPQAKADLSGQLVAFDISVATAQKFAANAVSLIASPEFMHQLSEKIGEPKPEESKEQFVARGKELAAKLLEAKLK